MSRKAYPTGIVTKPGLKNNHLAILRATIEPEHQVVKFRNIFIHSLEVSEPGACMENLNIFAVLRIWIGDTRNRIQIRDRVKHILDIYFFREL